MCTRNGGCPQQQQEAFIDQTHTTIVFGTSKNPPPTLPVHSNPTLRARIRAKMSFTHPQFCSRLLSAKKPAKNAFSLLLFLSPFSLKLIYLSIATFRALKRPKLTSERPETSRRLAYCVVTSHCTLGIPTFFAISHTFASAWDSKPREVGSSSIFMTTHQCELSQKDIRMRSSYQHAQDLILGLLTQPDTLCSTRLDTSLDPAENFFEKLCMPLASYYYTKTSKY